MGCYNQEVRYYSESIVYMQSKVALARLRPEAQWKHKEFA